MATFRVLLVEDESLIRWMLAEALEDEGFDVVEAVDGDEGIKGLETCGVFNVLLTDVRMPGSIDGVHLATYARARDSELPVVVVSGHAANLQRRLGELDPVLGHDGSQAVEAAAHVGRPGYQPDLNPGRRCDHRRSTVTARRRGGQTAFGGSPDAITRQPSSPIDI